MSYTRLIRETEILQKQLTKLNRTNEELQINIANYQNYSSLENIARQRLGMVTPKRVEFILINPRIQGHTPTNLKNQSPAKND